MVANMVNILDINEIFTVGYLGDIGYPDPLKLLTTTIVTLT